MALKNGDGDAAVTILEHDIVVVASSCASTAVDKGAWDGAWWLRLFVRGFEGMRGNLCVWPPLNSRVFY